MLVSPYCIIFSEITLRNTQWSEMAVHKMGKGPLPGSPGGEKSSLNNNCWGILERGRVGTGRRGRSLNPGQRRKRRGRPAAKWGPSGNAGDWSTAGRSTCSTQVQPQVNISRRWQVQYTIQWTQILLLPYCATNSCRRTFLCFYRQIDIFFYEKNQFQIER